MTDMVGGGKFRLQTGEWTDDTSMALCLACCQYFALVLQRALTGAQDKAAVFPGKVDFAMEGAAARIEQQSFRYLDESEVRGSGYVVESLEAALWAFWNIDSFVDAVLAAANLGDDADTTAAICGQLAGAYYEVDAIPADWLEHLYRADDIRALARRLATSKALGCCS